MSNLITKPLKIFILLIAVLTLTEVAYRNNLVNFHSGTFEDLNPGEMPGDTAEKPVVLVLGDEVSASGSGYVEALRGKFPDHLIINGAIPYSGPVEASWTGEKLIKKYNPDILIYQVNPANDLYNIRKGNDLDEAGFFSAITDYLSDEIKTFDYISGTFSSVFDNMSGAKLAKIEPDCLPVAQQLEFSTKSGTTVELQKGLIEYSSLLKSGRDHDMEEMLQILDDLFCKVKNDCRVLLTVVPHSTWVNGWYREQMLRSGNHMSEEFMRFSGNMPFMQQIRNHIFANSRVKIVDPATSLKNSDCKERRMYNVASDQLNKRGHEVLAAFLSSYIRYSY